MPFPCPLLPPLCRSAVFGALAVSRPGSTDRADAPLLPPRPTTFPLLPSAAARGLAEGGALPELPVPFWVGELCPVRGAGAVVVGGAMGFVFGLMFAGMSMSTPPHLEPFSGALAAGGPNAPEPPKVPLLRQVKDGLIDLKSRGVSTGKNFALVGGVYSTIECFLEQLRGRKDVTNAALSGFATGAVLTARAGPTAMAVSGAGFAAFSVVMELAIPHLGIFD